MPFAASSRGADMSWYVGAKNRSLRSMMTDIPAQRADGTWSRHTTMILPPAGLLCLWRGLAGRRLARLFEKVLYTAWGMRLFWSRHRFVAAVTTGAGAGVVFAALQAIPGMKRIPHVMIDCLWYLERNPLLRLLARVKFALLARSVSCFVLWSTSELQAYARAFGLPRRKLVFLPYHDTLEDWGYHTCDKGYIFAGGDGDRDYATFIEAVRGLDVPVLLLTRLGAWHSYPNLPTNVTVRTTDEGGFREAMSASHVVVVPLQPGLLHRGGQQTYVNAMVMGKPVIVCDEGGADDYIADGHNALMVAAGDVERLRSALLCLLGDAELRRSLCANAAAWAEGQGLSTDECMQRIVALTLRIVRKHGCGQSSTAQCRATGPSALCESAMHESTRHRGRSTPLETAGSAGAGAQAQHTLHTDGQHTGQGMSGKGTDGP